MANILITGASGLLGAHLVVALQRSHRVLGVDRHAWWGDRPADLLVGDLMTPGLMARSLALAAPDVVIHCAAMVDVEACEADPQRAAASNVELTRQLVRMTPPPCRIVYVSTDSVFDGESMCSTEDARPSPRTVYGRSKLQGEQEIRSGAADALIVRTNFYGWSSGRKQTAAEWLHQSLASGRPTTLFNDVWFTPIYVVDFVELLVRLIESGQRGVWHVGGRERVSKYGFGLLMARVANLPTQRVSEGSVERAPLKARRPKDTSLSSDRFQQVTGLVVPGCEEGLRRFLSHRGQPLSVRLGPATWAGAAPFPAGQAA